ncbi:hypothetical protein BZG36_04431 [Bifiguratus adelaidae]|uniref:Uncharacterized protein n=1 Tax=Bifiguratus adelaidae TaxID=1938954 RepID=A0A261XWU0_9FUNG|nr:hypothetical protein BZG36_04431 [Bifiguratus adelaidae]
MEPPPSASPLRRSPSTFSVASKPPSYRGSNARDSRVVFTDDPIQRSNDLEAQVPGPSFPTDNTTPATITPSQQQWKRRGIQTLYAVTVFAVIVGVVALTFIFKSIITWPIIGLILIAAVTLWYVVLNRRSRTAQPIERRRLPLVPVAKHTAPFPTNAYLMTTYEPGHINPVTKIVHGPPDYTSASREPPEYRDDGDRDAEEVREGSSEGSEVRVPPRH